ncbi:MAG: hypothetical protein FD134_1679 [Gallionellaceae bacterium]|nr:MAG: hypothetical protein FD134_1679 [Gallionellaceae bacterium]
MLPKTDIQCLGNVWPLWPMNRPCRLSFVGRLLPFMNVRCLAAKQQSCVTNALK